VIFGRRRHRKRKADHLRLTIGGSVPIKINTTDATASVTFENAQTQPVKVPEGVSVAFVSATPGVFTVSTPTSSTTGDGFTTSITPVAPGTAALSLTLSGSDLVTPTPVTVTVEATPTEPAKLVLKVNTG
jgi:hypothetical protein